MQHRQGDASFAIIPVARAFGDVWHRSAPSMSRAWQNRFADSVRTWFHACRKQCEPLRRHHA
ncbi:terpene synthase family protein [Streptomyces chartreusis]